MSKYIVKADIVGDGNPEYAPDKELREGIECDGFLLLAMKDKRPVATAMNGCTTMDLAKMLGFEEGESGNIIWQAITIAEGIRKAADMEKEYRKSKSARSILEALQIR